MHITTFNNPSEKGECGELLITSPSSNSFRTRCLRLSLSLSLSLFSLSGALPCGVAWWYGVLGLGAKLRSRCVGFETLDFNDSLTRGGLLPAPGGDESPRASTTKTIQSSRRGGGKMKGRRKVRKRYCRIRCDSQRFGKA